MTWQQVARKDFEDTVRSKMVWSIVAVFVVLMGIIAVGVSTNGAENPTVEGVIGMFVSLAGNLLIPVTALIVGYMAIVGERQSGSLRVLFGLSHSRSDVVRGKLVSRTAVMLLVTVVASAVAALLALVIVGALEPATFLPFVGLTLLLAVAFTALAIGISATTDTRMQAMGGAIGSYLVFTLLWHPLVAGVHYVAEGSLPGLEPPGWYFLLLRLNPMAAYRQSIEVLTGEPMAPLIGWQFIVEDIPEEQMAGGGLELPARLGGEVPVYLNEWAGAVILLLWVVVPAAVGYWRFQRADLN